MSASKGGYYLPEPSYWPIVGSVGLFLTLGGFANFLHGGSSLVMMAGAVVLLSLPLEYFRIQQSLAFAREARAALEGIGLIGKTDFALLRYVHFLAVAYLLWQAAHRNWIR